MEYDIYNVELKVDGRLLGGVPSSKEILQGWLKGRGHPKAEVEKTAEEVAERLPEEEVEEKVTTVFERDPESKNICVDVRHIRGFLKDAARALGLGSRVGFESFIRANVQTEPKLMPLLVDGKPVKEAEMFEEPPGHVLGPRGQRAILKKAEFLVNPSLRFRLLVLKPKVEKSMAGRTYKTFSENIEDMFRAGETIGFGKDRALGYGMLKETSVTLLTEESQGGREK